jgi:hypothetical protein
MAEYMARIMVGENSSVLPASPVGSSRVMWCRYYWVLLSVGARPVRR